MTRVKLKTVQDFITRKSRYSKSFIYNIVFPINKKRNKRPQQKDALHRQVSIQANRRVYQHNLETYDTWNVSINVYFQQHRNLFILFLILSVYIEKKKNKPFLSFSSPTVVSQIPYKGIKNQLLQIIQFLLFIHLRFFCVDFLYTM